MSQGGLAWESESGRAGQGGGLQFSNIYYIIKSNKQYKNCPAALHPGLAVNTCRQNSSTWFVTFYNMIFKCSCQKLFQEIELRLKTFDFLFVFYYYLFLHIQFIC